jgi:hypothetical protein
LKVNKAVEWLEHAEELLAARKLDEALAAFDRAEMLGADSNRCSGGRWMASMLVGDFAGAWRMSDALRSRNAPDPHRFWNGQDPGGKQVIVRCLHGLGDNVQMLRYAPHLARTAKRVIYEVAPRFVPLASFFREVREVITWGDDAPLNPPRWDLQVEITELPYLFRTGLNELPIGQEYLELPVSEVQRVAHQMGVAHRPRVGLVWAAGEWNPARSVPFSVLSTLFNLEGVEFWSLQGGAAAAQAQGTRMRDATGVCGEGLLSLAATIANLDLVITVDTLAAHLAGAIGRPVWTMLHHAADWRWMTGCDDSPWYPTMRLFRQPRGGDWCSVLSAVHEALLERGER